ncbi:hypothetical protein [Microbulbifer sp. SAOS-129_SWC]|uniref:hypothetical protein n=1 Tax=Microbulbifer sp. SAOS-129_SWC TaxID=3145235 RepID=UPI0032162BD5
MNELQRAEYLSALGVPSYMPRFVLPLAPQPRQARLPVAEAKAPANPLPQSAAQIRAALAAEAAEPGGTPDQSVSAAVAAELAPQAAAAPTPELARQVGELVHDTRAAPQPAPVAEVAPPAQSVEPFVLSCWWLGDELLAVDSREPGAALPVEALFNNIAHALGWHQLPREQDRLRWPLAENRFGPAASAVEARDTCGAWLEAASARRPVKSIWLMGEQARQFCAPVPLDTSAEQPVTDWNSVRIVAMPSLSELLREPQRKRGLWQLLQQTYPEQTRAR